MGRYFLYRVHPFSFAEIQNYSLEDEKDIRPPISPSQLILTENLIKYGGFPEPFLKQNQRFYNQWSRLRNGQLIKEDIRDLTQVKEIGQMELLVHILSGQIGQLTSYTSLAKKVQVSIDTIKRWISILKGFYLIFSVSPWSSNVSRSLLKEPKYYYWDWSKISTSEVRFENMIASHLLKAVHFWTDYGLGSYTEKTLFFHIFSKIRLALTLVDK